MPSCSAVTALGLAHRRRGGTTGGFSGLRIAAGRSSEMTEQVGGLQAASQNGMEPVAVARALRLERRETGSGPASDSTRLVAGSRSSHVEWTRNAGACVTPFNLQTGSVTAVLGSQAHLGSSEGDCSRGEPRWGTARARGNTAGGEAFQTEMRCGLRRETFLVSAASSCEQRTKRRRVDRDRCTTRRPARPLDLRGQPRVLGCWAGEKPGVPMVDRFQTSRRLAPGGQRPSPASTPLEALTPPTFLKGLPPGPTPRSSVPPAGGTGRVGLLDRVRQAIRTLHYSRRTEEAYVYWIRRFIFHHGVRHPDQMGAGGRESPRNVWRRPLDLQADAICPGGPDRLGSDLLPSYPCRAAGRPWRARAGPGRRGPRDGGPD